MDDGYWDGEQLPGTEFDGGELRRSERTADHAR